MRFAVVVADTARRQFDALDGRWRSALLAAMREHLRDDPHRESRSRIKRLRGMRKPQYRLRVSSMRLFYDVDDAARRVEIVGIVDKRDADAWFAVHGEAES